MRERISNAKFHFIKFLPLLFVYIKLPVWREHWNWTVYSETSEGSSGSSIRFTWSFPMFWAFGTNWFQITEQGEYDRGKQPGAITIGAGIVLGCELQRFRFYKNSKSRCKENSPDLPRYKNARYKHHVYKTTFLYKRVKIIDASFLFKLWTDVENIAFRRPERHTRSSRLLSFNLRMCKIIH